MNNGYGERPEELVYGISKPREHGFLLSIDMDIYLEGVRLAGWLGWAWLASLLTETLFTSRQNSIFLSQQSVGTVF